ncbi:MAG TPA: YggT family protein [Rickettsiales bacterium]|nr:YggT family protein [Rickettsiales bacterium]
MLNPIVDLILTIMHLYNYVLFAWMILSFLIAFNIVNRYQPAVQKINLALFKLTDPLLRPIRKYMPDLGGIDISPVILILIFNFVERTLVYYSFHG